MFNKEVLLWVSQHSHVLQCLGKSAVKELDSKGPPTATIQLPANFQLPPGECVPRAAGPHACPPASSFRAGKGELRQLCEMGKVGMSAPRVGSGMLFCPVRRVGEVRVFACLVGREERRRLEPGTVRGARST